MSRLFLLSLLGMIKAPTPARIEADSSRSLAMIISRTSETDFALVLRVRKVGAGDDEELDDIKDVKPNHLVGRSLARRPHTFIVDIQIKGEVVVKHGLLSPDSSPFRALSSQSGSVEVQKTILIMSRSY